MITILEKHYKQNLRSLSCCGVLADFYTLLSRAYMHMGYIDEAMKIIIRSKEILDIDRLGGLKDLDAKTARLVRAGIAAGRLVDGSGLATLFVKANHDKQDNKSTEKKPVKKENEDSNLGSNKDFSSNIIPFPTVKPVD